LCPGGIIEIIEEDILFPTILAPTVTFVQASGSRAPGVNGVVGANPRRTAKAHQNQLKATNLNAQQALHKQALIYSEETRPTAFLSPSSPLGMQDSDDSPTRSPLTPIDHPMPSPRDASFGLVAIPGGGGPGGGSGFYGIPASYLQYAQTVPALARSLPPLALVNPFLHQAGRGQGPDGQTKPFAQDHAVLQILYMAVWQRRWINLQPTKMIGNVLGMQTELGGIVSSECLEIAKPNLSGAVGLSAYPRRPTIGRRPSGPQTGGEGRQEGGTAEVVLPDDTSSARRRGSGGSRTLLDDETVIRRRRDSVSSSSSAFSFNGSGSDSDSDAALDLESDPAEEVEDKEKQEDGKGTTASAVVPRRPADEEENFMILEDSSDEDDNEEGATSMLSPPLTPRATSPAEADKIATQPSASTSGSGTPTAAVAGATAKDRKTKMKNAMSRAKKSATKSKQDSEKAQLTGTQGKDGTHTKISTSKAHGSSSDQKVAKGKHEAKTRKSGTSMKKSTRKYPVLSLTSALHDMFPGFNSEITKTIHLMHAWESTSIFPY
jgi:hypothetical protein